MNCHCASDLRFIVLTVEEVEARTGILFALKASADFYDSSSRTLFSAAIKK